MSENKILKRVIIVSIFLIVIALLAYTYKDDEKNADANTSKEWHEEYMKYDILHQYSVGETQVIALIDSGISDFQLRKVNKSCSLVKDTSECDTNGHGTMMCSLILGNENIVGIAPYAKLNSYKVVDSSGKIEPEILSEAINMAIKDKVTIINISLGSYFENELVKKAIESAYNSEITVVASSGDYETEDMLFPAKYSRCISVGAIDNELNVWNSTNAPKECTILAPGVDIKTIDADRKVAYTSGTSQATALVSGYIALLKDYASKNDKSVGNDIIKEILNNINQNKLTYMNSFEILK